MQNFGKFIFLLILMLPFNLFSQANLNNIKVWEGWKLGNVIKVSGIINYGNALSKADGEKRYLIVQKIDEQKLDSFKTIRISYNKELFSTLKNNDTITLLGYVSGSYSGIPKSNNYDIEYWQDESFHFDLYLVVLKEGAEIQNKKK